MNTYRKRKNFAVEIFSLYSRITLHRENIVREMSPCFSRVTAFGGRFAMDLRRYFQPIRGDALPDPKGPLSTTIPRQAIAEANKRVQEAAIAKASKKRGSYGHFDAKTRAAMGKYSCENGVVAAARYYSKALHRPVNESTVRTRHCQWSTETLQCLHNSLAHNTMSTM